MRFAMRLAVCLRVFLALLELVRHGHAEAEQRGRFEDIEIKRGNRVETPKYS